MTDKREQQFLDSDIAKLGERLHVIFLGQRSEAVLGVCLAGVVMAAKSMRMSKLDVQKTLVEMWDGVQEDDNAPV